ncbi:conserved hypothetical protein [Methylovorus sp. MP688]|nr:conserved hypothetical protein [Methylovorus sp. MP688]
MAAIMPPWPLAKDTNSKECYVRYPRLYIGLILASLALHASAEGLPLVVKVEGVKNDKGNIRAALYDKAQTFRKEAEAVAVVQQAASPGEVILRWNDLKPGRYAVVVYHDEDANGELNRRFGMFPTEGYGLSNNPKVSGPPPFEPSAFELNSPTEITVDLRY